MVTRTSTCLVSLTSCRGITVLAWSISSCKSGNAIYRQRVARPVHAAVEFDPSADFNLLCSFSDDPSNKLRTFIRLDHGERDRCAELPERVFDTAMDNGEGDDLAATRRGDDPPVSRTSKPGSACGDSRLPAHNRCNAGAGTLPGYATPRASRD